MNAVDLSRLSLLLTWRQQMDEKIEWDGESWRGEDGLEIPDPGFSPVVAVIFFSVVFILFILFAVSMQWAFGS